MSTIGFIGLGTMGRHMAKNLIKAGNRLVVYARRVEVRDEFAALGAALAASPAEVARLSDAAITIVTADPEVREVALGPGGLIEGAAPGKVLIEMSTIGPATVRDVAARLAERGMGMLDAPVSGGPWGAEKGTLAIMAGGDRAVFDRCRPILDAMGKHVFHVGPLGAGQTIKLINQLLGAGTMTLIAEAFVLGKACGVDLETLADVIAVSSANSSLFEARGKKFVLADRYEPGFMMRLMRKDLALALDLAEGHAVPVPVASAAMQQYTAAVSQGLGDADFAAVAKVCERAAGRRIVDQARSGET